MKTNRFAVREIETGVKYLVSGKYNPSSGMFIYYENGANCFFASENKDKKVIEICYGPSSGGADYWDISIEHKAELLNIVSRHGNYSTRNLLKFVRENDLNKQDEQPQGLGVKLNLVGKDGNAFALLAVFRQAARRQGKEEADIQKVIDEAKSGDYYHLVGTLASNCY